MDAVMWVMGYMLNNIHATITYGGQLRVPMGLTEFPPFFHEARGLYIATDST